MWWRSASKAGDGLGEILSAEASTAGGVLQSFNGLVLFLLHQAHTAASPYRKYICSLPLHVPLPLLWADEDLPDSFLSDPKLMAERLVAREAEQNWARRTERTLLLGKQQQALAAY